MITIAKEHYDKLLETVRLLAKNMQLIHPSKEELHLTLSEIIKINQQLNSLYIKITHDLD
jgi:hypothetical protein